MKIIYNMDHYLSRGSVGQFEHGARGTAAPPLSFVSVFRNTSGYRFALTITLNSAIFVQIEVAGHAKRLHTPDKDTQYVHHARECPALLT